MVGAITARTSMAYLVLHKPRRYSRCSSEKKLIPATSKTWPNGLYLNAATLEDINDQLALCAVTGSIAKAVKSVLDVPILSDSRKIHPQVDSTITNVSSKLPALTDSFRAVY